MIQAITKVKICGIRTLSDAQVAAQAGADFIGLVFVPGRRRRLDLDEARKLVEGLKSSPGEIPQVVGLFADQPLEEVNHTIETCNLDTAQLCGAESLDYCHDTKAEVIKVVHIPQSPSSPEPQGELVKKMTTYREGPERASTGASPPPWPGQETRSSWPEDCLRTTWPRL